MLPEVRADLAEAFEQLRALEATASPLLEEAEGLSAYFYANWFHELAEVTTRVYPTPGQFTAATALPELFRPGWTLLAEEPPLLRARSPEGSEAAIAMGDAAPADPIAPLAPGAALRVVDRSTGASNGFWHLWSSAWREAAPERIERLYLAIAPGAELAVARALARAAPLDGRWYAKFLSGSHPAGRRDPAVLYLPTGTASAPWVGALLHEVAAHLAGARVRATATHATGVGYARDPGGGRSFGQAVCDALAAAAVGSGSAGGFDGFVASVRRHVPIDDLLLMEPVA
jgi:hypothetical protein